MDQNLSTDAVALTKTLCAHLADARFEDLSQAARNEARRGVLDWIGCALAGSGHPTVAKLIAVLEEAGGRPQARGMQQNRGTSCKSFHAGKAAANGVLAALLAERGFDSTQEIVEGRKGFSRIYSDVAQTDELTAGLGGAWVIETNGHKPYACGVVLHPLIDAMIVLRNATALPRKPCTK
jgi:2-methylcitrate dehydratase PrpD